MIISPTTDNFSSLTPASAYTVMLPDIPINLEAAKTVSTAKTIGGGSSVSVWESSIEGEQIEFTLTVDQDRYNLLRSIKDSGFDEWLWRVNGKIYEAVFDLTSAVKTGTFGDKWRVTIMMTILTEIK